MKDKFTKKTKILIMILLTIIVLIVLLLYVAPLFKGDDKSNNTVSKEAISVNTNKGVTEKKEVNGFTFSDTSIVYEDGISTLKTTITNNAGSDYSKEKFNIVVKDETGNTLYTLLGYLSNVLKDGESQTIVSSINTDISKIAYNLEFKETE